MGNREEFEAMPEIKDLIERGVVFFNKHKENYDGLRGDYARGAWLAWQAQQAKIDELQARVDEALKILKDWDDQSYRDDMDQLTGEIEDILKAVEK